MDARHEIGVPAPPTQPALTAMPGMKSTIVPPIGGAYAFWLCMHAQDRALALHVCARAGCTLSTWPLPCTLALPPLAALQDCLH